MTLVDVPKYLFFLTPHLTWKYHILNAWTFLISLACRTAKMEMNRSNETINCGFKMYCLTKDVAVESDKDWFLLIPVSSVVSRDGCTKEFMLVPWLMSKQKSRNAFSKKAVTGVKTMPCSYASPEEAPSHQLRQDSLHEVTDGKNSVTYCKLFHEKPPFSVCSNRAPEFFLWESFPFSSHSEMVRQSLPPKWGIDCDEASSQLFKSNWSTVSTRLRIASSQGLSFTYFCGLCFHYFSTAKTFHEKTMAVNLFWNKSGSCTTQELIDAIVNSCFFKSKF